MAWYECDVCHNGSEYSEDFVFVKDKTICGGCILVMAHEFGF